MLALAFLRSTPNFVISEIPATAASSVAIFLSSSVVVGDLNITVSERIAERSKPAYALFPFTSLETSLQ